MLYIITFSISITMITANRKRSQNLILFLSTDKNICYFEIVKPVKVRERNYGKDKINHSASPKAIELFLNISYDAKKKSIREEERKEAYPFIVILFCSSTALSIVCTKILRSSFNRRSPCVDFREKKQQNTTCITRLYNGQLPKVTTEVTYELQRLSIVWKGDP